jgi:hypothetical protein
VAELVDALDSKSGVHLGLRVQVPSEVLRELTFEKVGSFFLYKVLFSVFSNCFIFCSSVYLFSVWLDEFIFRFVVSIVFGGCYTYI